MRHAIFQRIIIPALLLTVASGFSTDHGSVRLVFEEERSMRSSFCLYSDGKFYDAQASGCVGQSFAWGYWKAEKDSVVLNYSATNIFQYTVLKSRDTKSLYQLVRVVDCYDQPVRFQYINYGTGYQCLNNPGILRIRKGIAINYPAPLFDPADTGMIYHTSYADTITYKWSCNRESIESIDLGRLSINDRQHVERVLLRNRRVLGSR